MTRREPKPIKQMSEKPAIVMKKFRVRIEYRCVIREEVEATSEEDAIDAVTSQITSNEIWVNSSQYSADARETK